MKKDIKHYLDSLQTEKPSSHKDRQITVTLNGSAQYKERVKETLSAKFKDYNVWVGDCFFSPTPALKIVGSANSADVWKTIESINKDLS